MSGTRFDRGVRRDAVARVAAGESASAVARDVGCRHETVSRWCREAGVVLVRGRRGGSFEADRARRAQVVLAVLGGAGLPGAAAVAGVCRQSASRYWHDQVMETATAASARSSARSSGRRCRHGPSGGACSGRVGRGRRLSDAERVLIAQGRARGESAAPWAGAVRPSLGRSPVTPALTGSTGPRRPRRRPGGVWPAPRRGVWMPTPPCAPRWWPCSRTGPVPAGSVRACAGPTPTMRPCAYPMSRSTGPSTSREPVPRAGS